MGESKKYIVLSGFQLNDNNRGSAALGYGSVAFLREKGYFKESDKLCILYQIGKRFWKKSYRSVEYLKVSGVDYPIQMIWYLPIELRLYIKFKLYLPFTPFGKVVRNMKMVAATNGGDGLSDIYGYSIFINRLKESRIAMINGAQLIIMPQTIGPFSDEKMKGIARKILTYTSKIYVRDPKFEEELGILGLKYEKERDLSAWMLPEPWDITIESESIGLNVSGLAYFNKYKTLAGKFENYPLLIHRIIDYFQESGKKIYLIPHSYNYNYPEFANDDLEACKEVYNSLKNKQGIVLIDKDLTSPQIKYVISQMSFFIGTRMHANFAAIYSKVPVFGLAYSYKFEGAFEANGLSSKQTYMINNMPKENISDVIHLINEFYETATK